MDKIIPIAILVLFIILTASWLFSRYRMCPPDKILIVFGKVGTGQPAKCYHGGSTFVLPVLQSYSYLDLNPINIDVPLQGALSSQNIRVDVPSSFIVGISTLPEIMQNAAARLLGRSREEIRNLAAEIIMGQMRVVIASMTIEEINSDREKLIKGITEGVDVELHKVGLHLINANITDIQDASGYINALGAPSMTPPSRWRKKRAAGKSAKRKRKRTRPSRWRTPAPSPLKARTKPRLKLRNPPPSCK